jgi:sodium/proline symporter
LPIVIGVFALRSTRSSADFYVGGRAMDKVVVALSAVSSGRSSWLVLALSGMAYTLGTAAVWAVVGYVVVELFQFVYLGRRLRQETERYGSITLLDYFEDRFQDHGHLLRATGALIIAVFMTAYVAAQLNAGAKALSTALHIPLLASLLVAGALILVYMVLGGYIAVAYNDAVRGLIMLLGLVVLPAWGLFKAGGLGVLLGVLGELDPRLVDPLSIGLGALVGFLGIGLGSPGQPHIVVRYMSIDDPEKLRFAAVLGTFWNVVLGWGAVFVGLLARVLLPQVSSLPGEDPEMVYLVLSGKFFGPLLYGLLVGGIFAAILSTADSQLLVVASTFSRDIYEKILRTGQTIDEATSLKMGRAVVVLSGVLAMILAYLANDLIFWLVLFAWGGLGASFGATLILSLYWKKTHRYGVLAGFLTGSAVTIVWKLFLKESTGLYELIPAFAAALLATVIVSLAFTGTSATEP